MTDTTRRRALAAVAATAAATTIVAPLFRPGIARAQSSPRRWRMVTSWGKNLPGPGISAERLAQRIMAMSQGEIAIEVFPAGTIVPAFGVLDAITSGAVEMGHTASLFWSGKLPAAPLFTTVPFGLSPQAHIGWLSGGGQVLWDELYAPLGAKPFVGGNTGPSAGGWFKREITSLADIKGLRIRATGLGGVVYSALGATAVAIPPSDTYAALERGVIDAVELLAPVNDQPLGLNRIAPFYLFPGFNKPNGASETVIALKVWHALPEYLRSIVAAACHAEHDLALGEAELANGRALRELVALGVKPRLFPDDVAAAARAAATPLLARIGEKDALAAKIVASYAQALDVSRQWQAVATAKG
jgi:TRAP-type mannitol/chloroaromatic compound transport system substrate-binding protein